MSFKKNILALFSKQKATFFNQKKINPSYQILYLNALQQKRILSEKSWLELIHKKFKKTNWLFFTSPWAVKFFIRELKNKKISLKKIPKIAVLSEQAEESFLKIGIKVDFIAKQASSTSLASSFIQKQKTSQKIILLHAQEGETAFIKTLENAGHELERVILYKNKKNPQLKRILKKVVMKDVDAILASSALSLNFFAGDLPLKKNNFLLQKKCFVLGSQTDAEAKKLGFKKLIKSDKNSYQSLAEILHQKMS